MYTLLLNKAVKFQMEILNGCWENSKKLYGATFLLHPVGQWFSTRVLSICQRFRSWPVKITQCAKLRQTKSYRKSAPNALFEIALLHIYFCIGQLCNCVESFLFLVILVPYAQHYSTPWISALLEMRRKKKERIDYNYSYEIDWLFTQSIQFFEHPVKEKKTGRHMF